jgi:hypothetical protein
MWRHVRGKTWNVGHYRHVTNVPPQRGEAATKGGFDVVALICRFREGCCPGGREPEAPVSRPPDPPPSFPLFCSRGREGRMFLNTVVRLADRKRLQNHVLQIASALCRSRSWPSDSGAKAKTDSCQTAHLRRGQRILTNLSPSEVCREGFCTDAGRFGVRGLERF